MMKLVRDDDPNDDQNVDMSADEVLPPEDFCAAEVVRTILEKRQMTAEEALSAIVLALVDNHFAECGCNHSRGEPDQQTPLRWVEMVLAEECVRNLESFNENHPADESKTDREVCEGLMNGQFGEQLVVVCEILQECMKALGTCRIREAA